MLESTEHHLTRPAAPLLVLVHGALDRAQGFRRVVRLLPDLRVVTYDRRGYGGSVRARPATGLRDHADDLLAVIGDRRATVVAHSAGGHIAVLAAMAAPERIAGLALWEPSAPWMDFWPERARESVARISSAPDPGAIAERGIKAMVGREAWERLGEEKQAERRAEGDAFVLDMSFGLEPPYDWADLRVPCLIGHGAQWPHDEASPQLARAISCPTFTIEGAPHAAHLSHPEQFAEFARRGLALG